ncbi:hypothetical protein [Phyllobacterium sp. K27]
MYNAPALLGPTHRINQLRPAVPGREIHLALHGRRKAALALQAGFVTTH